MTRRSGGQRRERLIAQSSHEHHQMPRHPSGLRFHTNGQLFTDFLADRHVMEAADLDVALLCGMRHEVSNTSARETDETGPALSAGGHKTGFQDFPSRARVSQTGCGEIRPDLCRAIRGNSSHLQPVTLGQHREVIHLHFGGKTWKSYHRRCEEQDYCKG